MERIHYTSFDQIPVVINADCLAIVLGISRTTAYQLMHSDAFPTFRIGSRIVVKKEHLLAWIDQEVGDLPGNSSQKNSPKISANFGG